MHFFNPVAKMPLVEVIRGQQTSDEAALIINTLALKLKKTPIQCRDGAGFIVNRILGFYMSEACNVLGQGVSVEKIDKALKDKFGLPMGPFRLMDEVGLDVAFHVAPILEAGIPGRFKVNPAFKRMLDAGLLGKKNGKGFYLYDEKTGRSTGINPQLPSILGSLVSKNPSAGVSDDEIIDRCVLLMVNEAAYIVADGIALKPEDVDIGMIFGTGFPPFRGGVLAYAEQRGLNQVIDRLTSLQQRYQSDRFKPAPQLLKWAQESGRIFPNRPVVPANARFSFPVGGPPNNKGVVGQILFRAKL
jgi:3-hydroxyacyl-CoA dehydrogenase/enoyl-CoA hydratase/3-hydroxybutyryl-CoA epimerase